MDGTAVVVTHGHLADSYGKTAHGLIRGSDRFEILAVVDGDHAGRDAGELLDGRPRGIPVFDSIGSMLADLAEKPNYCIIGCATHGGVIPPDLRSALQEAARAGISIVNGLHEFLSDDPEWKALAEEKGISLIDVRKPPKPLHFWTGEILSIKTPRVAVLGTDCAVGKRTTARLLVEACQKKGCHAAMIYSGQTGWMQGSSHGLIFDSIPNDFVSGELAHAIIEADKELSPDVMFIEGQAALRMPSGPCGSEFIISGGARGVILQHAPGRRYYSGFEELGCEIPPVQGDIELIRLLGARTLALTLNGDGLSSDELRAERDRLSSELALPVLLPLEEGVDPLVEVIKSFVDQEASS